jgi:hypothetical protein
MNNALYRVPLKVGERLTFSSETGAKQYTMDNAGWLIGQSRVLFGESQDASLLATSLELPPASDTTGAGVGNGLSPFTTHDFNLLSFTEEPFTVATNPLLNAQELIVLFSLEVRTGTSDVRLPGVCQPVPPPTP